MSERPKRVRKRVWNGVEYVWTFVDVPTSTRKTPPIPGVPDGLTPGKYPTPRKTPFDRGISAPREKDDD